MNVQDKFLDPLQRPLGGPHEPRNGFLTRAAKTVRRRRMLMIGLCAVLLLAGAYVFFTRGGESSASDLVATATRGDVEDLVTALGSLQPLNSVDVGAQVSGQLKTLSVKIGDEVEKGQLLAEIDSAVMAAKVDAGNAQLQNLRAQLSEKQSNLALMTAQAQRQTRLKADNATSQDAFDSAQAALRSAEAQVKSVQAQINQSQSTLKADQATLGYSKIYAPMSGTVTAIPAKQGQTLNANQSTPTILTIADLSTMTVSTQVSEADVPKLNAGMEAYFTTLGAGSKRWTGTLRQLLPTPTVVNNVVLFTALFDVPNPTRELLPQMTAQVFFVLAAAHDAVIVPASALQYGRGAGANAARAGGATRGGRAGGRGRQGGAQQAANGEQPALQGRRGSAQTEGTGGSETARGRPATVTVVKDDGSREVRNVVVGVSDRVNAEIISGLSEGETVVAGIETAGGGTQQQRGRGGFGGFGGFR